MTHKTQINSLGKINIFIFIKTFHSKSFSVTNYSFVPVFSQMCLLHSVRQLHAKKSAEYVAGFLTFAHNSTSKGIKLWKNYK